MLFLSPLALLALVAALVPPLLHLFQRREPPVVVFPAVRYLQETKREAQRTVKLQHLLLMLLRILGVVLIVLAAARPVVPGGFGARHEPTALVMVFDHSLSSGAVRGGTRVLDDLAARARETLRDAQAGDAVWLIGADGLARRDAPQALLESVSALRPDARRLDLSAAVRQAVRLIATSGYARGEIHVLSDLQASAIDSVADSTASGLPIIVYHPGGDPPANHGVLAAAPWPALWVPGGGSVRATVGGGPFSGAAPSALSVAIDGRPGARALAGQGGEAQLGAPALAPGWHVGEVVLEPDELRADDQRAFAVRVVTPASVTASPDIGSFAVEALAVLAAGGRVRQSAGGDVHLGTAPGGAGASVVFPPSDPASLGATNRALANAGVPWRYGARLEREDTLAAPMVPELSGTRVRVRWRLEPSGGGSGDEVLARAGADPWLVRHERIVLVGSRLVPEETSLPLSGAFVPLLAALVNRIARGESGVISAAPGGAVTVPDRVSVMAMADTLVPLRAGDVTVAPPVPGVHALRAGTDTLAMLVVGFDPRESNLTRASEAQVAAAWQGARVTVTSDARALAAHRFRGAGRSELTGWLLLAALAILVAESLLATGGMARLARA